MSINVLFFGACADLAGQRVHELEAANEMVSADVLSLVLERFPKLGGRKLLYSINQNYATGTELVRDGDELAIFTAVSGG